MQYLLDANICIFYLRGLLNLDAFIREKGLENWYISEITVFEFKFGADNSSNPKKSHDAVDKFVQGISIIPIYRSVQKYAEYKVKFRKNGTPMHDEFDLLIGVTALENILILVTDSTKDFTHFKKLKLENWFSK